jgi:hypothetical protein
LLWQTSEAVPLQDFAIEQTHTPIHGTKLLLDGQQRLTSLAAVIRGKTVNVRGRRRPIELLFNLDHPDALTVVTEVDEDGDAPDDDHDDELQKRFNNMTFVVATKKLEQLPQWIKVTEVFKDDDNAPFLQRMGITLLSDPRAKKYSSRLNKLRAIKHYTYRMDILEPALSYDEVTEIFVRVNSLGAKLRSSDLALAQITAKWRGSLKTFQTFQAECDKAGFFLDLGIHLKNLIAFATGQSRFLTVGGLSLETLKSTWKECCPGMDFALNFLKSNAQIDSPALLSSPFLLITLAYYGHKCDYKISAKEARELRKWALLANAKGRYSRGSTETLLDQDLATIRQGGGATALIERLHLLVGRLDIPPEELVGRNQRSALFKTMFLAFRAAGARDWQSNVAIAMGHKGAQHRLQFHHIFPKAILRGAYTSREADDIANLAFIGGRTNQRISKKEPAKYFQPVIEKSGTDAFESQCIPTRLNLLDTEQYKNFLGERRRLISQRLNEYLDVALS